MKEESCLHLKSVHPPYEQGTLKAWKCRPGSGWHRLAERCCGSRPQQGFPPPLLEEGAGTFSAQRKTENHSETHIKSMTPGRLYAAMGNAG